VGLVLYGERQSRLHDAMRQILRFEKVVYGTGLGVFGWKLFTLIFKGNGNMAFSDLWNGYIMTLLSMHS